jgi:ABC-type sulfate transport system permease component
VHQEYEQGGKPQNVMSGIRRGVARFGSVVIVALVLESLIMVIKYSQKDLAGYLYYPAAIICSAALLLTALGLFARLTALPVRAARD